MNELIEKQFLLKWFIGFWEEVLENDIFLPWNNLSFFVVVFQSPKIGWKGELYLQQQVN